MLIKIRFPNHRHGYDFENLYYFMTFHYPHFISMTFQTLKVLKLLFYSYEVSFFDDLPSTSPVSFFFLFFFF